MTWQQSRRTEGQSGRPSPSVASATSVDIDNTPSPSSNINSNSFADVGRGPTSATASPPPGGRPTHHLHHKRSHSSSSRDLKNLENSRGWQVNKSGMAARRANRQEGEEVALWKSTQSDIKSVVSEINASNENTRQIAAIENRLATVVDSKDPDDQKLHTELLHQLDTLYRAGVKLNDAVVKKMGDVKEALMIVKALAQGKEDDAKGPGPGPSSRSASFHNGGPGGRSSSRAGKLDKERNRAERAERAERERERERELQERERERERERDREQRERETQKEREREREKDRDRDRERDREASREAMDKEKDKDKDKQDLYEFDGVADPSPHPSPIGTTHARKLGVRAGAAGGPSSDRSGNRDSVPPRDTLSKAGSVEPGAGVVGSSATRAKVVFVEDQDVAFKPKSSETGEWFLGRVKRVTGEGKGRRYIVKDEDPDLPESDRREYKMSASGMISIPGPKAELALPKLDKGKMVLALYPDSTTFYKAEVMGMDAATGSVALRFEGEEQSGTQQMVDRRFVVDYRE